MANKIRYRLIAIVPQIKLAGAQPHSGVDNFFTRPGHQVKQDEFVGVALRHVVGNFAHVETNQIIRHVFSQFEAGDDFAMNFVTTAAADTVVGMIF